jgi:hypothetical protein
LSTPYVGPTARERPGEATTLRRIATDSESRGDRTRLPGTPERSNPFPCVLLGEDFVQRFRDGLGVGRRGERDSVQGSS